MSPYFTCEQGTLYHGDCLEVMKHLPEGSIDLVLTDPPYGTTACKWDTVIPFEDMWERVHRVSKNNGAVVLFGSEPFSSALRMSNIQNYKYDWVWVKTRKTGFQHAKNMPLKAHELISVFSKGSMGHKSLLGEKRMSYHPQGLKYCGKTETNALAKFGKTVGSRPSQVNEYFRENSNYPCSTLFYTSESGSHPTQKPVALMEYLIKTYTLEGETVLDFTIGSGTTAVACVNTNRKFIGIEQDEKYIEIAKKRVTDAILAKTEDLENL